MNVAAHVRSRRKPDIASLCTLLPLEDLFQADNAMLADNEVEEPLPGPRPVLRAALKIYIAVLEELCYRVGHVVLRVPVDRSDVAGDALVVEVDLFRKNRSLGQRADILWSHHRPADSKLPLDGLGQLAIGGDLLVQATSCHTHSRLRPTIQWTQTSTLRNRATFIFPSLPEASRPI